MTRPQEYIVKLEDKKILNQKFILYSFELIKPNSLSFIAGQYVSLEVISGVRRSYSIASSPDIEHGFELLIDSSNSGIGVDFFQNLKLGQEITFLAPLGSFILENLAQTSPIVFVATGSGVSPFRSMILDLLQSKKEKRQITLYWGLRDIENLCLLDEFVELARNFSNFSFHPVLSRASSKWNLCRGRVTDCLSIHDLPKDADFYLCGRQAMIEDVKNILEKRSINKDKIHYEKYD